MGFSSPASESSVDVLPAPFRPISATTSPASPAGRGRGSPPVARSRPTGPRHSMSVVVDSWSGRTALIVGSARPRERLRRASSSAVPRYASFTAGFSRTSVGRAGRDHLTEVEHDDPIAGRHDEPDVVLDEQHTHGAVVGEAADQRRQLLALGLVEAGGRLVEHDDRRARRHRAGDADEPPAPVRQRVGKLVRGAARGRTRGSRSTAVEGRACLPGQTRSVIHDTASAGVGTGADVVLDADVLEQLERLERAAQAATGPLRGRPAARCGASLSTS